MKTHLVKRACSFSLAKLMHLPSGAARRAGAGAGAGAGPGSCRHIDTALLREGGGAVYGACAQLLERVVLEDLEAEDVDDADDAQRLRALLRRVKGEPRQGSRVETARTQGPWGALGPPTVPRCRAAAVPRRGCAAKR